MILSHGQWLEKPCIAQFLWRHNMWEADNDCPKQALYQLGTQYPGPVSQPTKELLTVAPTRPCINYSVSLEAVVWDGEQEDVFQYEPVRSKMIKMIKMMITYILGFEENSVKNLWLSESWAWILFRQKSGHWTRCQTPLTAWRCLISPRLEIGNWQLVGHWQLTIANWLDIGNWQLPIGWTLEIGNCQLVGHWQLASSADKFPFRDCSEPDLEAANNRAILRH